GCGVIVFEISNSRNVCAKCDASFTPFFPRSVLGGSIANSSNLVLALYRLFNAFSCGGRLCCCCRKSFFGRPAGKCRLHLKNSNFSCSILSRSGSVFVRCEIVWSSCHRNSSAQKQKIGDNSELALALANITGHSQLSHKKAHKAQRFCCVDTHDLDTLRLEGMVISRLPNMRASSENAPGPRRAIAIDRTIKLSIGG